MCLDETHPTTDFNIGLVVQNQICDGFIVIKIDLGIGWQTQPVILDLNLFDSLNTELLTNFLGVEILRQIEDIRCFLVNIVLVDDRHSSFVAEMHGDLVTVGQTYFQLFKQERVINFTISKALFQSMMLETFGRDCAEVQMTLGDMRSDLLRSVQQGRNEFLLGESLVAQKGLGIEIL